MDSTSGQKLRDHQELWEKRHPDVMNANKKNKVWMEIGAELGLNVKIIKKTWQGLRSQFMAFMKKLNKSSGSDGKQPFFSHEIGVGFLKGCEAGDIKTISNLDSQNGDENVEIHVIDVSQLQDVEDVEHVTVPEENIASNLVSLLKALPPSRSHSKFGRKRKIDEFDSEILTMMKEEDDEFDTFGKLISSKMRRIYEVSRKLFLEYQMKAVELIHEMEVTALDYLI
ncbi:hypothetical protein Fcan01_08857 [Folsomia candida]|uniref:MADF domain-containing protein n=1 Tax=Folsomia candida TaxID=158441 RepID=A0A226EG38_FOLCA|nr:hypothetical protein Fcan01_08857 [Folsomia candida]